MRLLKWSLVPFLILCWLVSGAAHAVTPPPCWPKVQWRPAAVYAPIPPGVSTRYDTYAAWVCDLPGGYVTTAWLFNLSFVAPEILNYARGTWSQADANADCAATCTDPTDLESTFIRQVVAVNKPIARVAFNGSNTRRSVYSTNADGTLNPTPVAGSSVAVAGRCDSAIRIPGTNYYSVTGQPNASKAGAVLADVYAVCVVVLAIGSN